MLEKVREALEQLAEAVIEIFENADLVYADPGERHVVSELFALLRPRFKNYTVSNEYDRREQEVKMLGKSRIIPDLIVHQVGDQANNLLVIELKLYGNFDYERDVWKLRGMTSEGGGYGYAAGVHLVLDVPQRRVRRGHVYIEGDLHLELTQWFEGRLS